MEKILFLMFVGVVYLLVSDMLDSNMLDRYWQRIKLVYYGLVFVYKTARLFGIKNGYLCLKALLKDLKDLK